MDGGKAWPCLQVLAAPKAGCHLHVAVSPNAKRTAADGLHDGCLRVRLAAPPVDGKANAVLQAWLAQALGVPRREVTLVRGETSRRKTLHLALPEAVVSAWLVGLNLVLGDQPDTPPNDETR